MFYILVFSLHYLIPVLGITDSVTAWGQVFMIRLAWHNFLSSSPICTLPLLATFINDKSLDAVHFFTYNYLHSYIICTTANWRHWWISLLLPQKASDISHGIRLSDFNCISWATLLGIYSSSRPCIYTWLCHLCVGILLRHLRCIMYQEASFSTVQLSIIPHIALLCVEPLWSLLVTHGLVTSPNCLLQLSETNPSALGKLTICNAYIPE